MAKDPAINWYFDNWDGGTKLFTRHQKGCYIDLLSAQFHCGHLTIENIKQVLGSDFAEWDKCLKAKFDLDEKGMFFNGRIEHEIEKRLNEKNRKSEGGKKAMSKRWGDNLVTNSLTNLLNKTDNKSLELELKLKNELKGGVGEKIIFPFNSDVFFETWNGWKKYLTELKKPYQTFSSEQGALQFLSGFDEVTAIEIIKQSIKNQWKNLRPLDKKLNESKIDTVLNINSQLRK